MIYVGIVIDKDVFNHDDNFIVDVGYGALLPVKYFIDEYIPNFCRPAAWLEYMSDRLSWPGMKSADKVICKVC